MTEVQLISNVHRPLGHFPSYSTMLGNQRRGGPPSHSSATSSPRGFTSELLFLTASPPSSSHHDYYSTMTPSSHGNGKDPSSRTFNVMPRMVEKETDTARFRAQPPPPQHMQAFFPVLQPYMQMQHAFLTSCDCRSLEYRIQF